MSSPTLHVVDDDESFLRAVTRLLRAAGFEVKTFVSADDFLDHTSQAARGCVISDLQMPGMNGLAFQEAMLEAGHTMPVIFLTGNGDIPSTVSAMKQGAVDFLEKRAPKEQLFDAVKRALTRDEAEHGQRSLQREVKSR
jgi:two-component system, LuxR family, response regulator FixJ